MGGSHDNIEDQPQAAREKVLGDLVNAMSLWVDQGHPYPLPLPAHRPGSVPSLPTSNTSGTQRGSRKAMSLLRSFLN